MPTAFWFYYNKSKGNAVRCSYYFDRINLTEMNPSIFRCWSLAKDATYEIENIDEERLYFSLADKYLSDGEFDFSGKIDEAALSGQYVQLLELYKETDTHLFKAACYHLTCLLGLQNIVGNDDFISQAGSAFSRFMIKHLESLDEVSRKSLAKEIGFICFANDYPTDTLLDSKGYKNGTCICIEYDSGAITSAALKNANVILVPEVHYSDVRPIYDYRFYSLNSDSINSFISAIIDVGGRIKTKYSHENEFRVMRIINSNSSIQEDRFLYMDSSSAIKKVKLPKNPPAIFLNEHSSLLSTLKSKKIQFESY